MSEPDSIAEEILRDALKIKDTRDREEFIRAACDEDVTLMEEVMRLSKTRESNAPTLDSDAGAVADWLEPADGIRDATTLE